jgi:hypothetical protein
MFDFVLASIYPLMVGEYQCPQLRGHCQIQPVINDLRLDFGTIFNQHTPSPSKDTHHIPVDAPPLQ